MSYPRPSVPSVTQHYPDLSRLPAAAAALEALTAAGWALTDGILSIKVTSPPSTNVRPALELLGPLADATTDVEVVSGSAKGTLRVRRTQTGMLVVAQHPDVPPEEMFDDPDDVSRARDAWDGDAEAALTLPMTWVVRATVEAHRLVSEVDGVEVRVAAQSSTVIAALSDSPFWSPGPGSPAPQGQTVYVALDSTGPPARSGLVSLTGPGATHPSPPPESVRITAPTWMPPWLAGLPAPEVLAGPEAATDPTSPWTAVVANLRVRAALTAWAALATDANAQAERLVLSYFGFKRVDVSINRSHILAGVDVQDALRLHTWATSDSSPDRLLAIRQVASFYEGTDLMGSAADVLLSAEVVYAGLRSDAVVAVVEGVREAQQQTSATIRTTIQATQALVKASADRTLAALVAVGGVIIANSTAKVSESVGRGLLLLVAGFLALLGLTALLVEGPALTQPLDQLADELKRGNPLLASSQRAVFAAQPSVIRTQKRATAVRWAVPALHGVLALVIVVLGFPSRYR